MAFQLFATLSDSIITITKRTTNILDLTGEALEHCASGVNNYAATFDESSEIDRDVAKVKNQQRLAEQQALMLAMDQEAQE